MYIQDCMCKSKLPSSPEISTTASLNGPIPSAFIAATFTEYLVQGISFDIVCVVLLIFFISLILSCDPSLMYWIT